MAQRHPEPARILAGGAPEGFDARLVAAEAEAAGGPVIHIARDDRRAEAMRAALAFLAPGLAVLDFPAWDCLPYDRVSPNADVLARRMATLAALARRPRGPLVLLTTVSAATQRVPAPETVAEASLSLRRGDRIAPEQLRAWLARMGFAPTATAGRLRLSRRHRRHLPTRGRGARPARFLRRPDRCDPPLRSGLATLDRPARGRGPRADVRGDPR